MVHFNLRFDARYGSDVAVSDLLRIMHTVTINATAAPILDGLQVDPTSLLFREEGDPPGAFRASTPPATTTTTTEPPPPRRCAPVGLDYCRRGLPYNATAYPNVLGHKVPFRPPRFAVRPLRRTVAATAVTRRALSFMPSFLPRRTSPRCART